MSILSDNYKKIVSEIEQGVSNPKELEFVKKKISELAMMFMDIINDLSEKTEARIKQIEEKQNKIESKMNQVEAAVNEIEGDIYSEDETNFEFEIVCPYCNNEFGAEITSEEDLKKEIECPECHNIIELDWNDEEDECSGHCGGCHGCGEEDFEYDDEEYNDDDDDM